MIVEFTRRLNELADRIVQLDSQESSTEDEEEFRTVSLMINNALHAEVKRLFEFYKQQQSQGRQHG